MIEEQNEQKEIILDVTDNAIRSHYYWSGGRAQYNLILYKNKSESYFITRQVNMAGGERIKIVDIPKDIVKILQQHHPKHAWKLMWIICDTVYSKDKQEKLIQTYNKIRDEESNY
jgi:hypothetical protein